MASLPLLKATAPPPLFRVAVIAALALKPALRLLVPADSTPVKRVSPPLPYISPSVPTPSFTPSASHTTPSATPGEFGPVACLFFAAFALIAFYVISSSSSQPPTIPPRPRAPPPPPPPCRRCSSPTSRQPSREGEEAEWDETDDDDDDEPEDDGPPPASTSADDLPEDRKPAFDWRVLAWAFVLTLLAFLTTRRVFYHLRRVQRVIAAVATPSHSVTVVSEVYLVSPTPSAVVLPSCSALPLSYPQECLASELPSAVDDNDTPFNLDLEFSHIRTLLDPAPVDLNADLPPTAKGFRWWCLLVLLCVTILWLYTVNHGVPTKTTFKIDKEDTLNAVPENIPLGDANTLKKSDAINHSAGVLGDPLQTPEEICELIEDQDVLTIRDKISRGSRDCEAYLALTTASPIQSAEELEMLLDFAEEDKSVFIPTAASIESAEKHTNEEAIITLTTPLPIQSAEELEMLLGFAEEDKNVFIPIAASVESAEELTDEEANVAFTAPLPRQSLAEMVQLLGYKETEQPAVIAVQTPLSAKTVEASLSAESLSLAAEEWPMAVTPATSTTLLSSEDDLTLQGTPCADKDAREAIDLVATSALLEEIPRNPRPDEKHVLLSWEDQQPQHKRCSVSIPASTSDHHPQPTSSASNGIGDIPTWLPASAPTTPQRQPQPTCNTQNRVYETPKAPSRPVNLESDSKATLPIRSTEQVPRPWPHQSEVLSPSKDHCAKPARTPVRKPLLGIHGYVNGLRTPTPQPSSPSRQPPEQKAQPPIPSPPSWSYPPPSGSTTKQKPQPPIPSPPSWSYPPSSGSTRTSNSPWSASHWNTKKSRKRRE